MPYHTLVIFLISFITSLSFAEDIVVIGDSLSCGPFGKSLVENLAGNEHHVTLYCAVSSSPINWLKGKSPPGQKCQTLTSEKPVLALCSGTGETPKIETILNNHKGARVIVGLGTNSLLNPEVDQSYRTLSKKISVTGAKCDWIGPPHLNPSESKGFPAGRVQKEEANLNQFYDSLAESIQNKCNLSDSRDVTAQGTVGNQTVDGIHRSQAAGNSWSSSVAKHLNLSKSHPESTSQHGLVH